MTTSTIYPKFQLIDGKGHVRGPASMVQPGAKLLIGHFDGHYDVVVGPLRYENIPTTSGLVNIAHIASRTYRRSKDMP